MHLKPQDVMVVLKLAIRREHSSYAVLADELGLSASEVHSAVKRCRDAGLLLSDRLDANRAALLEFLAHGLRYVLPAQRGATTRGMPTAHAAPVLRSHFLADDQLPPVWPDPEGPVRGETYQPIYRSAVHAARRDPQLYDCLALVDALRGGRARERKMAEGLLRERIEHAP